MLNEFDAAADEVVEGFATEQTVLQEGEVDELVNHLVVLGIASNEGSLFGTLLFDVLRRPLWFHLYMLFAFLTVLMTYFGVNYLLGGMHSYAG